MFRTSTVALLSVIGIQWLLVSCLLARVQHLNLQQVNNETDQIQNNDIIEYDGVAATLMLNSPKWFQRRYTAMVRNVLDNTPPTWAVQIFYVPSGQSQYGIDINPGILRMQETTGRIVMTEIPSELVEKFGMTRKKLYWTNQWMWETMVADQVLVFSGNGAICSNAKLSLLDSAGIEFFRSFDYIGASWRNFRGEGGSGSISYRRKSAMLDAIKYRQYDGNAAEDHYFISALKEMNKNKENAGEGKMYRIANKEETRKWSNMDSEFKEENGPPMIISGTLPNVEHETRNLILEMCPEIKAIFPSLHNPHCFGAHPNATGCAESICALQDSSTHPHGC